MRKAAIKFIVVFATIFFMYISSAISAQAAAIDGNDEEKLVKAMGLSDLSYWVENSYIGVGSSSELPYHSDYFKKGTSINKILSNLLSKNTSGKSVLTEEVLNNDGSSIDTVSFYKQYVGNMKFLTSTYNSDTGFCAAAFYNEEEVWIAFVGTNIQSMEDIKQDILMTITEGLSNQFDDLVDFYLDLPKFPEFAGKKVYLTGHSLGGALATVLSAITGEEAITINGANALVISNLLTALQNTVSYDIDFYNSFKDGKVPILFKGKIDITDSPLTTKHPIEWNVTNYMCDNIYRPVTLQVNTFHSFHYENIPFPKMPDSKTLVDGFLGLVCPEYAVFSKAKDRFSAYTIACQILGDLVNGVSFGDYVQGLMYQGRINAIKYVVMTPNNKAIDSHNVFSFLNTSKKGNLNFTTVWDGGYENIVSKDQLIDNKYMDIVYVDGNKSKVGLTSYKKNNEVIIFPSSLSRNKFTLTETAPATELKKQYKTFFIDLPKVNLTIDNVLSASLLLEEQYYSFYLNNYAGKKIQATHLADKCTFTFGENSIVINTSLANKERMLSHLMFVNSKGERLKVESITPSMIVTNTYKSIKVGKDFTLSIKTNDIKKPSFTYSVSDTKKASIDKNTGKITAKAEGTVSITVTEKNTGLKKTVKVTIEKVNLKISDKPSEFSVGDSFTMKATANVANPKYSWSVDKTSIATINKTTGQITAKKAGKVKITVTEKVSGKTKTVTVKVLPKVDVTKMASDFRNLVLDSVLRYYNGQLSYKKVYNDSYAVAEIIYYNESGLENGKREYIEDKKGNFTIIDYGTPLYSGTRKYNSNGKLISEKFDKADGIYERTIEYNSNGVIAKEEEYESYEYECDSLTIEYDKYGRPIKSKGAWNEQEYVYNDEGVLTTIYEVKHDYDSTSTLTFNVTYYIDSDGLLIEKRTKYKESTTSNYEENPVRYVRYFYNDDEYIIRKYKMLR